MTDIVFIADLFIEQGVSGGAEAFNDELIKSFIAMLQVSSAYFDLEMMFLRSILQKSYKY